MFGKNLKSRLEKLMVLVNEVDEKNYTIHNADFHNWLIESYDSRDEEIFGEYSFTGWIEYLIDRYKFFIINNKED